RVGADDEIRHRARRNRRGRPAGAAAFVEPALHLAGADRRAQFHRQVTHAHLLDHFHDLGAVPEPGGDLAHHHVAQHHRAAHKRIAHTLLRGVAHFRVIAQQVDEHRRVDRDHCSGVHRVAGRAAAQAAHHVVGPHALGQPETAARTRHRVVDVLAQDDPAALELELEHAALGQAQRVPYRLGQGDLAAFGNSDFHGAPPGACGRPLLYIPIDAYFSRHTAPARHFGNTVTVAEREPRTLSRRTPSQCATATGGPPMADSFATQATFQVNGKTYTYASLPKLGERFDIARLPFSMKILLENL